MKTKIKITAIGAMICSVFVISCVWQGSEQNMASAKIKTVSIPKNIKNNHYGFLSGGNNDAKLIKAYGARWVRPHPGPFLWDSIQSVRDSGGYNFTSSDRIVKKYSKKKIGVLATLWPFADWDQLTRDDSDACKVSDIDIFLPRSEAGKDSSGQEYLPQYRCNPNNWTAYLNWVKATVERYDGDGRSDMRGLKIPVKYWEVMNEPDLEGTAELDFYVGNYADYTELLNQTYAAIKEADPGAKVLISGAAGGDDQYLNFYRDVLLNETARSSFDIFNVHCISSGFLESLNVETYKDVIMEYGLGSKLLWVTEAETTYSDDPATNANQLRSSVTRARQLGASRIFFTRYNFSNSGDYNATNSFSKKQYKKIIKIK
jgi:hypothetical protein